MEKTLAKVASGVMSSVIIVLGVKVIYNELPNGTQRKIENKGRNVYRAVKDAVMNKMEPV